MYDNVAKAALLRAVQEKTMVDVRIEDDNCHLDAQLKLVLDKVHFDENEKRISIYSGNQVIYWDYDYIEENTLPTDADKFYIKTASSITTIVVKR